MSRLSGRMVGLARLADVVLDRDPEVILFLLADLDPTFAEVPPRETVCGYNTPFVGSSCALGRWDAYFGGNRRSRFRVAGDRDLKTFHRLSAPAGLATLGISSDLGRATAPSTAVHWRAILDGRWASVGNRLTVDVHGYLIPSFGSRDLPRA